MTEEKWLTTASDPHTMAHFAALLAYPDRGGDLATRRATWPPVTTSRRGLREARRAIRRAGSGGPTDRKLALFAAACCRLVQHLIVLPSSRRHLIGGERLADGAAARGVRLVDRLAAWDGRVYFAARRVLWARGVDPGDQLLCACEQACLAARELGVRTRHRRGRGRAGEWYGCVPVEEAVLRVRDAAGYEAAAEGRGDTAWNSGTEWAPRAMCGLARDIFGNPFRPVGFNSAWRTDTAVVLARQMYESRDFGAMPILADALQDAGCDRGDILDHCRGDGPHVRGCWVVDLVLGKE